MQPQTRNNDELIIRRVGDELIIYDLNRDQGHALNQTAAFVFEQCDGQTTVEQMAARMAAELNIPHAKQVTSLALDRLYQANLLLNEPAARSASGLSRREVLKLAGRAGLAAAMLPVVTTLMVPSAAQAQSAVEPPGGGNDCQACDDALNACLSNCDPNGGDITICESNCYAAYQACLSSNGCI